MQMFGRKPKGNSAAKGELARILANGEPEITELPYYLLPALAVCGKAETPEQLATLFDESIPETMHVDVVADMLRRPTFYRPAVVSAALRRVPFAELAKRLGPIALSAAYARHCVRSVA